MTLYRFSSLTTVLLESAVLTIEAIVVHERQMGVLHEAMTDELKPLRQHELRRFVVRTGKLVNWRCFSLLVAYYSDISYCRDISAVRYGTLGRRPVLDVG